MKRYLDLYLNLLPESQKNEIRAYLLKNADFRAVADQVPSDITSELVTQYIAQEDLIDSNKHNTFFANVYNDLYNLFTANNNTERDIYNFEQVTANHYTAVINDLNKLKQRIKAIKLIAFKPANYMAVTEQFNNYEHMDQNENLYLDRDGTPIPKAHMQESEEAYELVLSYTGQEIIPSSIAISETYGGFMNGTLSNFSITAYNPINAEYKLPDDTSIKNGAIALINIDLTNVTKINHIYIDFNLYKPVRIPCIIIYDSLSANAEPYIIRYDKDVLYGLSLNIQDRYAKRIVIPILNTNYSILHI